MRGNFTAVLPFLLILLANVMFALNYSYSKTVLGFMSPEALVVCRIVSGALFFVFICLGFVRERVLWRDVLRFCAAGLFGIAGNQYIFLQGLSRTSPVDASILATTSPILVLIIATLLCRERATVLKFLGVFLGAVGAYLIVSSGGVRGGDGGITGNLLVLISALSYACYLLVVKGLMARYSPFTVMGWVFGLSSVLILFLLGDSVLAVDFGVLGAGDWGALCFVIFGGTWLAYLCVVTSLRKLSATSASIFSYLQPVLASCFAIMRGQDTFCWLNLGAALLVFVGVYFVTLSYRRG